MKVRIEKFKQLDDIEVNLDNVTLLIGGNNAGKSSILQAIQFGVSVAQATKLLTNAKFKSDSLPTSIGKSELIYLPINDVSYLAQNGKLGGKGNGINIEYENDSNIAKISISKGKNKNITIHIEGEALGKQIQSIEEPFSILVTGLAGIPSEEKYQTPFAVKKSAARGDSNSVFRNILLLLKETQDSWELFQDEIKKIFPNCIVDVHFDKDRDEFINCTIVKDDNILYPIDSCGTGILQVIQIVSYIFLFKPKILLLDEPDSHLHPNNQRILAQRLLKLSETINTKIVIATHSKYLIDELIEDSKLLWLSNGKIQNCENNQIVQLLMGIGALDSGQRLSPPKWVVLTEDTDLAFLKILLTANKAILEEGEISSYKGCTKIDTAQALLEHLRSIYPSARFIIHRDRDFLSNDNLEIYKRKFKDVQFLIPEYNDIESFFITEEHLSASLGISSDDVKDIIRVALEKNKENLIQKYANVKKSNYEYKEQADKAAKIAIEAFKALNEGYNPEFIHGKEMLKSIRKELSERRISDNINVYTDSLRNESISALFDFT